MLDGPLLFLVKDKWFIFIGDEKETNRKRD